MAGEICRLPWKRKAGDDIESDVGTVIEHQTEMSGRKIVQLAYALNSLTDEEIRIAEEAVVR